MARYAGKSGSFKLDATTPAVIAAITKWDLDTNADVLDVTGMDSGGVKDFIAGLTDAGTATFSAFATGAVDGDIRPGTLVKLELYQQSGDTSAWYGYALIKSVKVSVAVDGAIVYEGVAQYTMHTAGAVVTTPKYGVPNYATTN